MSAIRLPRIRIPTDMPIAGSSSHRLQRDLAGMRSVQMNLMHEELARAHIRARLDSAERHRRSSQIVKERKARTGVRRAAHVFRRSGR